MKMKKLIKKISDFFDTLETDKKGEIEEKEGALQEKLEKKIASKRHKLRNCKDKYAKKELQKEIQVLKKLAANFENKIAAREDV